MAQPGSMVEPFYLIDPNDLADERDEVLGGVREGSSNSSPEAQAIQLKQGNCGHNPIAVAFTHFTPDAKRKLMVLSEEDEEASVKTGRNAHGLAEGVPERLALAPGSEDSQPRLS